MQWKDAGAFGGFICLMVMFGFGIGFMVGYIYGGPQCLPFG